MDQNNYETVCGITLNRLFGYDPSVARRLIERFGSPGAVFSQSRKTLDEAFGPFSKVRDSINDCELEVSRAEWERLSALGCRWIGCDDPAYPPLLADCPDSPVGLYFRSCSTPEEVFGVRERISIVGTRDISPYGKEWTERIVGAIAHSPVRPVIVSGFAIGVDITAHLAAMAWGLPTIAVLPVGIDEIYPRRHYAIAEKLLRTPGCALVTDFPPATGPQPFTFLRRNRIIAGLSRATVLAESKDKGGGTLTARLAAGYGREVFCLPGRIDDIRSAGCNRLLREKIAEPITDPLLIGVQLGLGASSGNKAQDLEEQVRACYSGVGAETMEHIVQIAQHIRSHRGVSAEELCHDLDIPFGDVSAAVCLLESDGFISVDLLRRCTISHLPGAGPKRSL